MMCFPEAAEEASSSTALQYESERAKLKELNENYEEEIQSIRSKLSQERHVDKTTEKGSVERHLEKGSVENRPHVNETL